MKDERQEHNNTSEQAVSDLIVVGSGPGGYTAAFRAADLGLSVTLVERGERLGGVCLNVGCIPSKTLLHAAEIIRSAREGVESGITFGEPEIDLDAMRARTGKVVGTLTKGLASLCKSRKITIVQGEGRLVSAGEPCIVEVSREGTTSPIELRGKDVILATGSHPVKIPGLPYEDPRIWDSTMALSLPEVPKRLLVIGGGIIGLEMAAVYHELGSEITIVEMLDQIIPPADSDIVRPLFLTLKKRYKGVYVSTRVVSVTAGSEGLDVTLEGPKAPSTVQVDAVLAAVGRRPNTRGIVAEGVDLQVDERGFVQVDERLRTSLPHVSAIGDITGNPMLAHKAAHEGKVAAEVIAGHAAAFTPMTIPSVAYTDPEVAWMGLTEKDAVAQGITFKKGSFPWQASGRALSADATLGVTKALFDEATGRILGAGFCGRHAGELLAEAVLALELGADAADISATIHAHPTLSETFAFAAEIVDGSITDILPPKPSK